MQRLIWIIESYKTDDNIINFQTFYASTVAFYSLHYLCNESHKDNEKVNTVNYS